MNASACRTSLHGRDARGIPCTDILVERPGTSEHPVHGRDARGVPSRYIRVEGSFVVEQAAHARHQRHVPVGHLDSPRGAAVRAVAATRHAGGIDGEAVVHRGLQRITCPQIRRTRCRHRVRVVARAVVLASPACNAPARQHALVLQAEAWIRTKRRRPVRRVGAIRSRCAGEPGVGAREHPRRVRVVGEGPAR